MLITLSPLHTADPDAVEALLDAAFGADRRGRTAYRLREGTSAIRPLSFAARNAAGVLIASLQCWPVALDAVPMVLVGPVAVHPDAQRGGIGRQMMQALLAAPPIDPMVLIGDPEYYGRFFGFSAEATQHWSLPGPVERHRLLARSTTPLPRHGVLGPRTFALAGASA